MTSAKLPRQTASGTPVQATEQVYAEWLATLKQRIQEARLRAAFAANAELVKLYWQIGNEILQRQQQQGWGAKVVDRLAKDLKKAFPEMKGFSRANLMYMRTFAATWSKDAIVQQAVGQLPWGHNLVLLEQLDSNEERLAYARLAVEYGWSRNVLVHHIDLQTAKRIGKAQNNFQATLPPHDSDLAQQSLKDPYKFEFLGLAEGVKENRLRQALVDRVADFLLELGAGFAYVGKAVPLEVGGDAFELDLLFYHLQLHCYVVIELKTGKMRPEHVGKLSFYMTAVDRQVKSPQDGPTIGLLLCRSKNKLVAEYSLQNVDKPIGISSYELPEQTSPALPAGLPAVRQLEAGLTKLLEHP